MSVTNTNTIICIYIYIYIFIYILTRVPKLLYSEFYLGLSLWTFFLERIPCSYYLVPTTTISLQNLVTRTSSSFVIVNLYCWNPVFTTTVSVYSTFNNKYFQFYVHYSSCCCRHLGWITAITDGSKLLSFTLNYFYTYCLAGSTTLLLFLFCFKLFTYIHYYYTLFFCLFPSVVRPLPPLVVRPLPPLWYQSHSFLAGDSVVVSLFLVRVYLNLWYSIVVFPSYRRWCHLSRKVNS